MIDKTSKNKTNLGYVLFLSAVAAIGGILFGYDTAVISGTIGSVTSQFGLDTMQQGWYVGCALIGSIFGVAIAGTMSDGIGRKYTMLISAILFSVSAIGCALCNGFTQLVIFRIIGGIGIGTVSIVSPIYISEVSPAEKRGMMVSLYQLAVTVGFLLAYLVNFGIVSGAENGTFSSGSMKWMFSDEMWRGMLGSETAPALLFLAIIFFIPESPRWLIVKGRIPQASSILAHIYRTGDTAERLISDTAASIGSETKSQWKELLSPGILKAVIIGSAIAILEIGRAHV